MTPLELNTFELNAVGLENVLVVKIGGALGDDMARCADDLARLAAVRPLIVVHGVSAVMDALCADRGLPVRTITSPTGHSSRYTDAATRDVFVEAAEQVNRSLVHALLDRGVHAVGLIGDQVPLIGERKAAIRAIVDGRVRMVRDDYSGSIVGVNTDALRNALHEGSVVVVPPMAASADGLLNVDGDRAGAAIAGAFGAHDYVILSGVRGLYRRFPDESSFIARIAHHEIETALEWAQGRMKRKVIGAAEALTAGVRRVVIADGRAPHPVSAALNGAGTEFCA
ncbi:MAG: [LysW]-aminoadipate kinase [Anaerolineae bacterium]